MPDDILGPTGQFPHGKVAEDDKGELRLAISISNGVVRIDFGVPTEWIGLPKKHAMRFAAVLVQYARDLPDDH